MKKVLVITYYWPPAGGPGVQRVLKFCKYLPEFGWHPVVLTVKEGEFPDHDNTLANDIPENIAVYRTNAIEPYGFYRKLTGKSDAEKIPTYVLNNDREMFFSKRVSCWIRGNLFIPDARVGWIPFALRKGLAIVRKHNIDLIFSSGPPQTVHLIARGIAHRTGTRWVADFRDPWTDVFYYKDLKKSRPSRYLDQSLERRVLASADAVTTVSPSIAHLFSSKMRNNYFVISNGFDEEDFRDIKFKADPRFRIVYTGNLGKYQNPVLFFEAISKRIQSNPSFKENIGITFIGNIHDTVRQSIEAYDLTGVISIIDYVSHTESVRYMVNAEILLLIVPDCPQNEGILTGKLFEYMAARRYILGIGPVHGDAAAILQCTGAGIMVRYGDIKSLDDILWSRYKQWCAGRSSIMECSSIDQYSRKVIARKLSHVFEQTL